MNLPLEQRRQVLRESFAWETGKLQISESRDFNFGSQTEDKSETKTQIKKEKEKEKEKKVNKIMIKDKDKDKNKDKDVTEDALTEPEDSEQDKQDIGDKYNSHQVQEEDNGEEMMQLLNDAVQNSCEGLMVKALSEPYIPGRSYAWVKLKKDYLNQLGDTMDLVPIGGYYGKGRRTGTGEITRFGAYLLACYDPEENEFPTICKIGTGFSDEVLDELSEFFSQHLIPNNKPLSIYRFTDQNKPDVWFEPSCVWECKGADPIVSPVYMAGYKLFQICLLFEIRN
ncbi:MAG: putative DNA ligase [Streblomastix strix]|uniref:Putative DNA ligase n=1 Tax=Streblomastix strix TaxID=222440 RepID=A0A5J4TE68_9EUKA|nr:MAG: putative DNA ligase [Streblomastix strix]